MKILQVLTYYQPHVSGLTIYVDRLSRALAQQGHEVTVLTSQYDPELPLMEIDRGVSIHRVPVMTRISKGVIMPSFGPTAWKMVRNTDIVHLHLPQFDAPGVALRGRLLKKPVILTYHSDLRLPSGLFNRFVDNVVAVMNRLAGRLADAIVTYTRDFGQHSSYLSHYTENKLIVIPPPVEITPAVDDDVAAFRIKHKLENRTVVGISARLAAEKGIEVLLKALPSIVKVFPDAVILQAGPVEKVLGEEEYAARLQPLIENNRGHYISVGTLRGVDLTAFYRNLDCLVLCSLNNTETFGLVQIEAMMNGVPVIASNLPGVRQPVNMTGFGEIAPVGDPSALAEAIVRVLSNPDLKPFPAERLSAAFAPQNTADEYLELYETVRNRTPLQPFKEPAKYIELASYRATESSTSGQC